MNNKTKILSLVAASFIGGSAFADDHEKKEETKTEQAPVAKKKAKKKGEKHEGGEHSSCKGAEGCKGKEEKK
jgi:hypothetical protein